MNSGAVTDALRDIARTLPRCGVRFALVGGLAVSIRGEVRFTRDVDVAVDVEDDTAAETLIRELQHRGYVVRAIVEDERRGRLSTIRLRSPAGPVVDLLAASSGVEREIVARAEPVEIDGVGVVPTARAEELLALKVLSMSDARPQDLIDAGNLVAVNPDLDLVAVRALLARIAERGFDREQDLNAKLERVLKRDG